MGTSYSAQSRQSIRELSYLNKRSDNFQAVVKTHNYTSHYCNENYEHYATIYDLTSGKNIAFGYGPTEEIAITKAKNTIL